MKEIKCKYGECNKAFVPKRSNQEYCTPAHKTKANNEKARARRQQTSPRDLQLRKNLSILDKFYTDGRTVVAESLLLFYGFNAEICIGIKIDAKNQVQRHYYQYHLERIDNTNFKIVKT